jgi:hypothetical protein
MLTTPNTVQSKVIETINRMGNSVRVGHPLVLLLEFDNRQMFDHFSCMDLISSRSCDDCIEPEAQDRQMLSAGMRISWSMMTLHNDE